MLVNATFKLFLLYFVVNILAAVGSPMLQRKVSNPTNLAAPPHVFQKQNSCPQLLISQHPSIQDLLQSGAIDKDQLKIHAEEYQWQMTGLEANNDRKTSWK